jgi:hypothetical protein
MPAAVSGNFFTSINRGIMNTSKLWLFAILPLALTACGGDRDEATMGQAGTTDTMAAVGMGMAGAAGAGGPQMLTMDAANNSGVTGDVMMMPQGTGTEITVRLRGAPTGARMETGIHRGRCGSEGPDVAELNEVTMGEDQTGSSTTVVQVPMATIMNGQHAIHAHEPGGSSGRAAVCANIPTQE